MLDMQSLCLFNSKYDTKMHPMIFWKQIMDTQVFRFLKYDVYDTISKCRVHVEDLRYTYTEVSVLHSMTYRILKLQHASFWVKWRIPSWSRVILTHVSHVFLRSCTYCHTYQYYCCHVCATLWLSNITEVN